MISKRFNCWSEKISVLGMKTAHRGLLLCALVSMAENTYAQAAQNELSKPRLAILPLLAPSQFNADAVSELRARLVGEIDRTQHFNRMSDAAQTALIADLGLVKPEECALPSCLALLGQKLGVERILHGSVEGERHSPVLRLLLVHVDKAAPLFEGVVPLDSLLTPGPNRLEHAARHLASVALEPESSWRWYHVAGAVLAAGTLVLLISKSLSADKKESHFENPPPPPPPPPGN